MKIFQVISSLGNGGAEKLVVELSNELANNHDVTIVSLKKVEDWMYPFRRVDNKVRLIQLNKKGGFDLRVLYRLFALLKTEKPDIVQIHLKMPLYYFIFIIPFFKKIKFYHTIHSTFEPHKRLFERLKLLPFYRRVVNICLSKTIFEQFKAAFPKLKFSKIENGIKQMSLSDSEESVKNDVELFRADAGIKVFLYIGSLTQIKNIPLLLEAFSEPRLNRAKLIIIGKGSPEITEQVQEFSRNASNRIVYLGPKENVADYMQHVDALILTSRFEGLPIVILEALSAGLPVLSTSVGGIPDVITDGVNGFLSASAQKQDIAAVIDKFCKLDTTEIKRIREANLKLFDERFSIKSCAKKHDELYDKWK